MAKSNSFNYDRSVELRCVLFWVLIKSCHSRDAQDICSRSRRANYGNLQLVSSVLNVMQKGARPRHSEQRKVAADSDQSGALWPPPSPPKETSKSPCSHFKEYLFRFGNNCIWSVAYGLSWSPGPASLHQRPHIQDFILICCRTFMSVYSPYRPLPLFLLLLSLLCARSFIL